MNIGSEECPILRVRWLVAFVVREETFPELQEHKEKVTDSAGKILWMRAGKLVWETECVTSVETLIAEQFLANACDMFDVFLQVGFQKVVVRLIMG